MPQLNYLLRIVKTLFLVNLFLFPSILLSQTSFFDVVRQLENSLEKRQLTKVQKLLEQQLITKSSKQKIDSLLIASKLRYAKGEYLKAKTIAKSANQLAQKESDSLLLFKSLSWQGKMYIEFLELDSAKLAFHQAEAFNQKSNIANQRIHNYNQYHLGLLETAYKNYSSADSIFNLSLIHISEPTRPY